MPFSIFNAFRAATLLLFTLLAVSNAAPVSIVQDTSSLTARGNAPSIALKLKACPTVEEAMHHANFRYLEDNALFWSEVGIPKVEALAKKHGKKQLRDVFSEDVIKEIQRVCHQTAGQAFLVMSEAMATLARGEAWVLKEKNSAHDQFWETELATMKHHKQVTALWRVDESGKKLEQIPLH